MKCYTIAMIGLVLVGCASLAFANPVMLPMHPGHPSGGEYANDTGQNSLTIEQSLSSAAGTPVLALTFVPPFAVHAKPLSPVQQRESPGARDTDQPAKRRSEPDVPAIPPSQMDPGMQHIQEGRDDPHASRAPRNLDPSMSTNPDVASPGREGIQDSHASKEFKGSQESQ